MASAAALCCSRRMNGVFGGRLGIGGDVVLHQNNVEMHSSIVSVLLLYTFYGIVFSGVSEGADRY